MHDQTERILNGKKTEIVRGNTSAHQASEDCTLLSDEEQWAAELLLQLEHRRQGSPLEAVEGHRLHQPPWPTLQEPRPAVHQAP